MHLLGIKEKCHLQTFLCIHTQTKFLSHSDRGTEVLSLTDVLWHELSSADMRTAEGFDSVHSKYPAPSGADQNRRLS